MTHSDWHFVCTSNKSAAAYQSKSGLVKHDKKHFDYTLTTKCRGCLKIFASDAEKWKRVQESTGNLSICMLSSVWVHNKEVIRL